MTHGGEEQEEQEEEEEEEVGLEQAEEIGHLAH